MSLNNERRRLKAHRLFAEVPLRLQDRIQASWSRNKHKNVSDTVSTAVEISEQTSIGILSFDATDQSNLRGSIGKLSGVTAERVSYLSPNGCDA
jgi:hypothetical protein